MKIKLIDKFYYNRDTVRKLNITSDDIIDFTGVEWVGRGAMHEFIKTKAKLINLSENVEKMYKTVQKHIRRRGAK